MSEYTCVDCVLQHKNTEAVRELLLLFFKLYTLLSFYDLFPLSINLPRLLLLSAYDFLRYTECFSATPKEALPK